MPTNSARKHKPSQAPLCYLQWHYGGDDPAHGRLSLSVIPADKAQAAALRAALRRESHPFTTLYHGSEQDCLRERARIDALTVALREAGGTGGVRVAVVG